MFDLIKELTELPGPVGQEDSVLERFKTLWQATGAKIEQTQIGNVLGRMNGDGPKLLLVAHADELCYLVRAIDESGFLWLARGQSWSREASRRTNFMGQRVKVLSPTEDIPGVIATATGHAGQLFLEEPHSLTWDDFWVDTGLSREALLEKSVTPGTRIIWDTPTTQMGPHIVGKALDDRVPLAILTELIRRLNPTDLVWNLTVACTVQEEIGLIGAAALGGLETFDAAIALEIGLAGDIPGITARDLPIKLGEGPLLIHKDAGVHYDYRLTQQLAETAQQANIPIQHAIFGSFRSDGVELMKADIPSALMAFPGRYTHSPFETGHLADIEAMVDWLYAFVTSAEGIS